MFWGISSNGRAPALHAGSTGIDTRILQNQDFANNANNHFVFSFFFCSSLFLIFLLIKRGWCVNTSCTKTLYYIFLKILLSLQQRKVLVAHSLFPTAEKGKDHYFGVSDDLGEAALYELPVPHSLPK